MALEGAASGDGWDAGVWEVVFFPNLSLSDVELEGVVRGGDF